MVVSNIGTRGESLDIPYTVINKHTWSHTIGTRYSIEMLRILLSSVKGSILKCVITSLPFCI